MAKEKKTFSFDPLPIETTKKEVAPADSPPVPLAPPVVVIPTPQPVAPQPTAQPTQDGSGNVTKVTFDCDNALLEHMKDYGYWEGLTQKDIILEALALYFSSREVRPRPDKIKNRPKVGRKPKAK
jgi:hypothetical protein